jgi:transcriptional regulator with XRE-family HTH domain
MDLWSIQFPEGRDILARVIRDIRRLRNLRASELAQRMGLPVRSYELFEAGRGRLDLERLFSFAEATDSDPFAIVLSVPFKSAAFAVACADTKLALIMVMLLQDFYQERGDDITYLDPPNIIGGFERVFKELGGKLDDNDAFLRRWFEGRKASSISLGSLSVRGLGKPKD